LSEFLFTMVFVVIGCYQFFEEYIDIKIYKDMGKAVLIIVVLIYLLEFIVVQKLIAMKKAEDLIRAELDLIEKGLEKSVSQNV